jgi:hypothetical protein
MTGIKSSPQLIVYGELSPRHVLSARDGKPFTEETMRRILLLGAALMLTSPVLVGQASAAGTALPQMNWAQSGAATDSIVEKAGWRHRRHCRRWNRKCRFRWGWGWRYRRCMRRHRC